MITAIDAYAVFIVDLVLFLYLFIEVARRYGKAGRPFKHNDRALFLSVLEFVEELGKKTPHTPYVGALIIVWVT